MALNPLTFTEKVVGDFLKYQLTAYPFTDPGLNEQMRRLLSVGAMRQTPLLKGPYISLSRAFRTGKFGQTPVAGAVSGASGSKYGRPRTTRAWRSGATARSFSRRTT